MLSSRIWQLAARKMTEDITLEELQELEQLLKDNPQLKLQMEMHSRYVNTRGNVNENEIENAWQRQFGIMKTEFPTEFNEDTTTSKVSPSAKKRYWRVFWTRVAVAATVLLAVALGGYLFFIDKTNKPADVVQVPSVHQDVRSPETNRATITLSNGNVIYLDSANNGTLVHAAGAKIIKLADGQLAYKTDNSFKVPEYNTIFNPRGSKILNLTLDDGTKVWLNSGTLMRFPLNFTGSERRVEVTGEAYFEVAKDPSKPFRVAADKMEIEVLGTHFNVSAYSDEEAIKTTLLEGSVQLSSGSQRVQITPGQQASFSGSFKIDRDVDIDKVMAWKNGMFVFDNAELPVIMRQISRWYNVDIVYEKTPGAEEFGGGIGMQVPLSNVLKMLEANGVQCEMRGNTVIVKP